MDKRTVEATIKIGDEVFHLKREVAPEKVVVRKESNYEKAEKAVQSIMERYKGYAPAIKCNAAIRAYGLKDGHQLRNNMRIRSRWDKEEKQYFWSWISK